jgi:acetylornithine/N-succinyldiaminopimelate aminotransferase
MYYYARKNFTQGNSTMTLQERDTELFFHTYKRLPLEIVRGEGSYLFTANGRRYLDMFGGIAVNALGHAHPRVLQAITDQAAKYIHVSNYFVQEPQVRLATLLTSLSGFPRVFFCNSGTEAIEGALKIARKWGSTRDKKEIVAFSNAFHGRSFGALSLMDRPSYRDGFGPFLPNCTIAPFNDLSALHTVIGPQTAAVVLEFIQGEGGIRPASPEFINTLLRMREVLGFLVIADEIQTGAGRTGKFLACEHFDLRPDLVTLAKPIGGGLPLGAILGTESVAETLHPGMHGTTFGGNPVACAAGAAVMQELVATNLMQQVADNGAFFTGRLMQLCSDFHTICKEVRGKGLMLGMELAQDGTPFVAAMRERGILINCTDTTVLRFVPPLIITRDQIRETVDALRSVLAAGV